MSAVPTLREYLEQRLAAESTAREAAEDAHRREHALYRLALEKAETALTLRLEAMNEVRRQLDRQAAQFVPLPTYEARQEALQARISGLERQTANWAGRFWSLGVGLSILVVLLNVVLRLLDK